MNDQRSVTDQMRDLVQLANRNGLYDAADWVNRFFPWPDQPPADPTGEPTTIPAAGGLLWPHGERIEP
jgi:hypothetical protein